MNWSVADFVVFGALLGGVGLLYGLAARRTANGAFRSAVGVALASAFLLIWANGAVGLIGDERNDANLMFLGVLAVAVIGAAAARLRPPGMAGAMYVTAVAQLAVAVVALVGDLGSGGAAWPWDLLGITGLFTTLWVTAGRLFAVAARTQGPRASRSWR